MAAEIRVDRITSRTGINTLSFTESGISYNFNVGFGTTSPRSRVDVEGDVRVSGVVTATNLVVTGNVSVAGTVTSMDVTNVDSVGIITAQQGLQVLANGINIIGVSTLSGGVNASQGADLARLRVTGITTLGQTNTTGFSNAGVSTLGNATASTLVVSGVSTLSGGVNASEGVDLARLRVTGITTLGNATATTLVVSGVSTLSGGVNASQGADLARLRVTGIATHGQTTTTGLSNAGVSTLGNATATTLSVSGFSTFSGGVSVTSGGVNVSGVVTATSFSGSGTNLTGLAALATAQTFTAQQRGAITALTDGATITPDFSLANNFSVTLGGNRTLANPTNLTAGASGVIFISQDGTGSRTLSFGSYWDFPDGTAPTLTTTASAVDLLVYTVRTTTSIQAQLIANFS